MKCKFSRFVPKKIRLHSGVFENRFKLNRNYVASLKNENLLQNFFIEAGLASFRLRNSLHGISNAGDDLHWGWETHSCQLRGHFLGHWLSAAAQIWASQGDFEIKAKTLRDALGGRHLANSQEQYKYRAQKRV
jgi:DUF1680 family protein